MSWIEKLQTDFTITTGDGKEYKPLWRNATKSVEFNIATFNFPKLAGTKIDRGTPKGWKYPIEIYFQGEDHIDVSKAFEQSASDPRPWTVVHPLYGIITVHPADLNIDNTGFNISRITGTLLETLTDDNPKSVVNPADKIINDKESLNEVFAESYVNDVTPTTNDITSMTENATGFYNEGKKSIKSTLNAEEYFNAFNTATSFILNVTNKPLAAIQELQNLINYPIQFVDGVRNRIRTMTNQFNRLRQSVSTLTRKADKKLYENNGGMIISSIAVSSVVRTIEPTENITAEYGNRGNVLATIEELTEAYSNYLEDLDAMQTENGGSEDSYIPDPASMMALNSLVNFTVAQLFDIALQSKQERSILLEDDSNVILLAHRFYGLAADDSTIEALIANNNIGLSEILQIRKGRKIIYYV